MKRYQILCTGFYFETREDADDYANEELKLKQYTIKDIKTNQVWEYEITETKHKYRLTSTDASSQKYGVCMCCGEHATEVFIQSEGKYCEFEYDGENMNGYTEHNCNSYFGHKECLINKRR